MTGPTDMETFLWWESSTGTLEDDSDAPAGRVEALFTSEKRPSATLTEDEQQALDQAVDQLISELKPESFITDAVPEASVFDDELPIEVPYGPVGSAIRIMNRAGRAARGRAGMPPVRPVIRVYEGTRFLSMHPIRNVGDAVRGVELEVGGPAIEEGLVRLVEVYIESLSGPRPQSAHRELYGEGLSAVSFDDVVVPARAGANEGADRLRLEEESSLIVRLRLEGLRVGSAELHLAVGEPGKEGRRLRREMIVVEPDDEH